MIIHNRAGLRMYFGDAQDNLFSEQYLHLNNEKTILDRDPFFQLKESLDLEALLFLKQVHSNQGFFVDQIPKKLITSFSYEGDFLFSQVAQLGLGVMTADCLPLIFFDARACAVAIAHVGWRGAVKKIIPEVLYSMRQRYGSKDEDISIILGPSAKACCYQVSEDFLTNINEYPYASKAMVKRGSRLFFDLPQFCILQLLSLGVSSLAIQVNYNVCTICNDRYYSHRRQGAAAGRQMTVVTLVGRHCR